MGVPSVNNWKTTRAAKRIDQFDSWDGMIRKILNEEDLNETEQLNFERIKQVVAVMANHGPNEARKVVQKMFDISPSNAWTWMQKAKYFFGEIDQVNVKTERALQKMRLENMLDNPHITISEKIRVEKLLMQLLGTAKAEEDQSKRRRRIRVVYSNDPKALQGVEIVEDDG